MTGRPSGSGQSQGDDNRGDPREPPAMSRDISRFRGPRSDRRRRKRRRNGRKEASGLCEPDSSKPVGGTGCEEEKNQTESLLWQSRRF